MGLSLLEQRIGEIAGVVDHALASRDGEHSIEDDIASCARWISTGAGASEGPARLFATLMRARGVVAEYAPISSFVSGAPKADACVVVSQSLSPNARLPLSRASEFRRTILVSSVDATALENHVRLVQHGPREEKGLLLRVVGPAAANATIIRLVSKKIETRVSSVLATSRERALHALHGIDPAALFDVVGLVASGDCVALLDGLRHKMLEGLGIAHPPAWDLCGLVHGPLQSFYERRATLIHFARDEARDAELGERLARVLSPERHRVIRITSSLEGPLALIDFDLQLDYLVLEALRARPRDLADWPGKGCDSALYDLGPKPSI